MNKRFKRGEAVKVISSKNGDKSWRVDTYSFPRRFIVLSVDEETGIIRAIQQHLAGSKNGRPQWSSYFGEFCIDFNNFQVVRDERFKARIKMSRISFDKP